MTEKVSVVIPTYNRADIIDKCIDSVRAQTYKNIEIIIVDDCSTDNTEEIVTSIKDDRIIYLRLDQNHRACYARNYGALHSTGRYVAFQDSDDTWALDKLEKQVAFIKKTGADIVFCGLTRVEGKDVFYFPRYEVNTGHAFLAQELVWNAISTQTILLKREVMDVCKFDTAFKKYQDWDFGIQLAKNCKVAYLKESLATSVILADSISTKTSHYDAMMMIYNKYQEDINANCKVKAQCYERIGDCFRTNDSKRAKEAYEISLKAKVNMKVLVKFVFSCMGIKR